MSSLEGLPLARPAAPGSAPVVGVGAAAPDQGRLDSARDIRCSCGWGWLRRIDDNHVAVGRRRIIDPLGQCAGRTKKRGCDKNQSFHAISPKRERQGGGHRSFTVPWVILSRHSNELAVPPHSLGRGPGWQASRCQIPDCGGSRSGLAGLRLLRGCRHDAGAGHIGPILDTLRERRLAQEGQKRDCRKNAAHAEPPERGA